MNEKEFGKLIEKLIYFSGQKNYSLATELGYDVSYISKWINSTMLPSAKNIKNIIKITSNFIVDSSSDSSLDDMINYFEIDLDKKSDKGSKTKALKGVIEEKLDKSYSYSYNKYNKKSQKYDDRNNSIQRINPTLRKKYLDAEVLSHIDEVGFSNITVICNLFSLSKDDKVHIAGIRRCEKQYDDRDNLNMKFLISFDESIKDIVFDVMLFISMVTSKGRVNVELYSCEFSSNTLIAAVKDKYSHTAIYNNTRCISSITSTDEDVVNQMYDTLEDMISTQSRPTFLNRTPEQFIINQDYMNYIMDQDISIVMGDLTELFMPSDLFLELGEDLFADNKDVSFKLKRIDTILQNFTYKSDLNIFIYGSAFRSYVTNGNIKFFNKVITLNIEQRKRHLQYMKKLLDEKDNINIRFIENSLIDDIKSDEKHSLYISRNLSFLVENYNGVSANYLIVKDKRLDKIFKSFFSKVSIERKKVAEDDKEETKKIVSDALRYIEIINNNIII